MSQVNGESLRKRTGGEVDGHEHGNSWMPHVHTHSHSHSHGAEGSAEEADRLLAALKGKGKLVKGQKALRDTADNISCNLFVSLSLSQAIVAVTSLSLVSLPISSCAVPRA